MVDFNKMLDDILKVEQEGFDATRESYFQRIPSVDTNIPATTESVSNGSKTAVGDVDEPTINSQYISDVMTSAGYSDPFANMATDEGINFTQLNTLYNTVLRDKELGITPENVIDIVNREYQPQLDKSYYEGAKVIKKKDETLGIEEDMIKKTYDTPSRFEKIWSNVENKYKYLDTAEDPDKPGKARREFATEQEMLIAKEAEEKRKNTAK